MALSANQTWYNRTGASVSELNGGGFDPSVTSPGVNYADQNAPQVTLNGTTITLTTSGTSATVLATGFSTSANDVGNTVRIASGTNFTTGYYTIVSVSAGISGVGTWTFDRNCTSGVGAAAVGRMGGAHADLRNYSNGGSGLSSPILTSPLAAGHIVYIRSAGSSANPSIAGTADYDYSAGYYTFPIGNSTSGNIKFIGLGASETVPVLNIKPAYKPLIKYSGTLFVNSDYLSALNFKGFTTSSPTFTSNGFLQGSARGMARWCIFDANGADVSFLAITGNGQAFCNNWCTNTGGGAAGSNPAISTLDTVSVINITDNLVTSIRGPGIYVGNQAGHRCRGNIVASCGGYGITVAINSTFCGECSNNTVYNAGGDAFIFTQAGITFTLTYNNTASKIPSGKFAYKVSSGTAAVNDKLAAFFDYNNAYLDGGAGGLYSGISAGAHDVNLDPQFTDPTSATWDFSVGTNLKAVGIGMVPLA